MKAWKLLCGLLVVHQTAGEIRLSQLEYEQLPDLVAVDNYRRCMHEPGDVYCFVRVQLHGNMSDPLFNLLVEYSASNLTHFDHTRMYRGVCPKRSCQQYMNNSSNLTEVIEACLNDSLTKEYSLTSRVYDIMCDEYKEDLLDESDYAFGILVLTLLVLNLLGSLYDFYCRRGIYRIGGRILLSFSVRENWRRLVRPSSASPMQRRIRAIYAFKVITASLVIFAHAPIPSLLLADNPQWLEETYHSIAYHVLYNGTLLVQTFFILSALLLAYNILLSEERTAPTWYNLPMGVLHRWLRLTPVYALVTFYVMTMARHVGEGPFHAAIVTSEADACRRDWWRHLLYIQNYKDGSQCMAHAWYLAADFQLTVAGLMVFCLLYSHVARKLAIVALLVVGLLTPALHTFLQDLHPVLIVAPEVALNFFVNDPTFNNLYKRGHTNLSGYAMGLGFAYVVYKLKESEFGAKKYKKCRVLYWLLPALMIGVIYTGSIFYNDGIVIPLGIRVVYSSAVKAVFSLMMILFTFFTIVKADGVFRWFLHWPGWVRLSRVSYCAYLVHVPLLRMTAGYTDLLIHASLVWQVQNYTAILTLSYLVGLLLFVLVEAPLGELVRVLTSPAPREAGPITKADIACKENIEIKL